MANPRLEVDIVADTNQANRNMKSLQKSGELSSASIAKGFAIAQIGIAAASKVIQTATGFIKDSIAASNEQIASVTKLNAALESQGNLTATASQDIQDFASQMQRMTTIGDEVTIGIAAQIEAMTGLSGEALPGATQAAIQLSKAFGIDLKAAATLVGKELNSTTSALTRYGITIDKSASQTEQLNQILDATKSGMAIAKAEAETFQGRIEQLDNAYGDLQESIGSVITQNQTLAFAAGELTNVVNGLITRIRTWFEQNKSVAEQITKDVLNAIILFTQGIGAAVNGINTFILVSKWFVTSLEMVGKALLLDRDGAMAAKEELLGYNKAIMDNVVSGAIFNDELNALRADIANFEITVADGAVPAVNSMAVGLDATAEAADKAAKGIAETAKAIEGFNYQFSIFNDDFGGGALSIPGGDLAAAAGVTDTTATGGGGGYSSGGTSNYYSGSSGGTFSGTISMARRGLPIGGFSSQMLTPARNFPDVGLNFNSPFHGTLFPNAQGSIAGRGTSEANPLIVKIVGPSMNLAEAVV